MAKIWRNRIEGGTQKSVDCPARYYDDVIALIKSDFESEKIARERLRELVESENLTADEYETITGEAYTVEA